MKSADKLVAKSILRDRQNVHKGQMRTHGWCEKTYDATNVARLTNKNTLWSLDHVAQIVMIVRRDAIVHPHQPYPLGMNSIQSKLAAHNRETS